MTLVSSEVHSGFLAVLEGLTEKEKAVIMRRIGLSGERETLQSIGDDYGITRERVRQIEDVGIRKIGRIVKSSRLLEIQSSGEKILRIHGGLLTRDRLISRVITELGLDSEDINDGIVEIVLQSDFNIQKSKPQLGTLTYFTLPEVNRRAISEIHKEALRVLKKRGDIIENTTLYEMVKINLFAQFGKIDILLIDATLDVFLDIVKGEEKFIGLEKWKILNPSTLKDKAIYILKKKKEPTHFVDMTNAIAEHFKEPVKVATIHNELIRNNEFVLIGRGIYVLKEWGYKPGTVLDVIMDVFNKAKAPLSTEEIIAKVLKVRQVKTSTIYMNLQNRKYVERVGRNMYQLKQS